MPDDEPLERGRGGRVLLAGQMGCGLMGVLVGIVAPVGLLVLFVASSLLPSCDPALPTNTSGEGKTDELDEVLDRYGLRLPGDATAISYHLRSSIDADEVGVRFRTTTTGLSEFLHSDELRGLSLVEGRNPWDSPPQASSSRPRATFGWDLASVSRHAGLTADSRADAGWLGVFVDLDRSGYPVVYAYSLACC